MCILFHSLFKKRVFLLMTVNVLRSFDCFTPSFPLYRKHPKTIPLKTRCPSDLRLCNRNAVDNARALVSHKQGVSTVAFHARTYPSISQQL